MQEAGLDLDQVPDAQRTIEPDATGEDRDIARVALPSVTSKGPVAITSPALSAAGGWASVARSPPKGAEASVATRISDGSSTRPLRAPAGTVRETQRRVPENAPPAIGADARAGS